jgi:hypothetical protein
MSGDEQRYVDTVRKVVFPDESSLGRAAAKRTTVAAQGSRLPYCHAQLIVSSKRRVGCRTVDSADRLAVTHHDVMYVEYDSGPNTRATNHRVSERGSALSWVRLHWPP